MRLPPTPSYDGGPEGAAMADPVGDIIGDYRAFAAQQHDRLLARGIDIRPYPLSHPLEVLDGKAVPLIELIPPVHQRVYKMGLEHLGVVVGDTFDAFVGAHKPVLTGQQFQGPNSTPDPVYILFEDFTHVKFYRLSLQASVEAFEGRFEAGFSHVDGYVPQQLATATG